MVRLTTKSKIAILKDAIKHLKRRNCNGMCIAIFLALRNYDNNIVKLASSLHYNYPDFTHNNYMNFYRFNKIVKLHADCEYWDRCDYSKTSIIRRIIFLRYLILKLRIQQFKQWYTTLR